MARRLTVNADDFGFTRDVNQGIVAAHRGGILTSTTLMANGAAFDDAVRLARETPTLDLGVHCVLVGGEGQPRTVAALLEALALRRLRPYDELKPQVERIVAAGIRPTHLDTHKHTHLWPPVLEAVARLGEEYGIGWVRRPLDLPGLRPPEETPWVTRALGRAFHLTRRRFERVLSGRGLRWTDHFAGFTWTGRYTPGDLAHLIRRLPEGVTEFMCHPGYHTPELDAAPTRLKASRQREMEALTHGEVRRAIEESGVELLGYDRL